MNNPTSCEIELTTACNALCPQCVRSYYGAHKWPNLPNVHIDLNILDAMFDDPAASDINFIRLVGTYGDPIAHPQMLRIVKNLKNRGLKLLISTNGGLRSPKWWKTLAEILDDKDTVMFGIDGLEDTNHLYRVGVNYNRVIENLVAFNKAGGKSLWQFIVFKHNQHQIDEARELSKSLGCYNFAFKPTSRFLDKKHQLLEKFPVLNKDLSVSHYLEPPTIEKYRSLSIDSYKDNVEEYGSYNEYLKKVPIRCAALHNNYFSVSAQGYIFPCPWLYDRMYGFETETHQSSIEVMNLIKDTGGLDQISLHKQTLGTVLSGNFFNAVKHSWTSEHRLERCANQCGVKGNVNTSYKEINKVLI